MERSDPETHAASCAAVRKLVYEFLDEELLAPVREQVSRHLGLCPPCAGFYTFERAYLLVLKRRTTVEAAPAELRAKLLSALATRNRQRLPES